MKPSKIGILLVLMLFVGVCGLLYPSVSQYWNSKTQTRAVENYKEILESLKPEDYEEYLKEYRSDCHDDYWVFEYNNDEEILWEYLEEKMSTGTAMEKSQFLTELNRKKTKNRFIHSKV
jgi:hypothetical protein